MEDERNLTLFVFYIIEERTSMTEIFVVKKGVMLKEFQTFIL